MRISTIILISAIALAIAGGAYWYCMDGHELFNDLKNSDNIPFMIGR